MKILFLLGSFPKISETFILNQLIGLQDLGIEVDVLASRNPEEHISHKAYKNFLINKNLFYFDNHSSLITRIITGLKILKNISHKSIKIYQHPLKLGSLHDLFLAHKLVDIEKCYDVVHAHFGNNGILASKIKKWGFTKAKVITSFYGYDTSLNLIKNDKYYKPLIDNGDLNISISNFMKQQLIDLGFPSNRILIHKLGIDVDRFPFSVKKISEKIKLLTIARLVEKKGIPSSIMAFKKVVTNCDNYKLEYNIIGDGEKKGEYKRLIAEQGLKGQVNLLGLKSQEEIIKIIYDSHIFILPSVTANDGDMEGTPVSIMEAMATAMPVISTYHSGIPELIKDGVSGFLVPEKNIELLADKILYVINHPESWSKIGISARKFVEQNHNINTLNNELIEIYQQLLNN